MENRPKCWVVGLGRTGTSSMCEAMRILGYRNVAHNPRFERLKDLDAGADNGVVIFYKYLDYKFPNSKFVLTLRDLPSWLSSMEYITSQAPIRMMRRKKFDVDVRIMRQMLIYETVGFDAEKFTMAYHRHYDDVKRYFRNRPNDLLEMNIFAGDGWEGLCDHLNLPVPSVPFPHLHGRPGKESECVRVDESE